jgi:hypothetical protein
LKYILGGLGGNISDTAPTRRVQREFYTHASAAHEMTGDGHHLKLGGDVGLLERPPAKIRAPSGLLDSGEVTEHGQNSANGQLSTRGPRGSTHQTPGAARASQAMSGRPLVQSERPEQGRDGVEQRWTGAGIVPPCALPPTVYAYLDEPVRGCSKSGSGGTCPKTGNLDRGGPSSRDRAGSRSAGIRH